ncbi:hypothetical protein BGW39_007993 [Mortierella sp. 14UC]|nr:hypothetical protein BGW39_007993 [Mortierella sp. 14UC]
MTHRCYQILFFQEASWALAQPVLEQLQSLTIPYSTIGRYLESPSMFRLERLERVHFIFDVLWEDDEQGKDGLIPMVKFVQEHTRLFPGVLKSVTSSDASLWDSEDYGSTVKCPASVQIEINRMLPALRIPTSLATITSLLQLLAHPDTTDLSRVEELGDPNYLDENMWALFKDSQQHILQRCRALRRLDTEPLGQDCFKWALEEKRLAEQIRQDALSRGVDRMVKDMERMSHELESWREGLIPLEEFRITSFEGAVMDEVDNAAIAFNYTLKSINAYYYGRIEGEYEVLTSFDKNRTLRIGKGWDILPALTDLTVQIGVRGLALDPLFYSHLPNVVSVELEDNVREYRYEDLVSTCLPARLPKLKSLTLQGLSALNFHPATLHSTTQLNNLSLTGNNYCDRDDDNSYYHGIEDRDEFFHPFCFIPPVEELNRSYGIQDDSTSTSIPPALMRPKWTWDWHLPHLVSLTLASEFAYLFEFHMLHDCPALKDLELEMRTATRSHSRIITSTDMYTPNGDAIILPALTKLRLHGPWEFTDLTFVKQFLAGMFPSLESLSAFDWTGLSERDMICIARFFLLKELCLSFRLSAKELVACGLVNAENRLEYEEEKVMTRVRCYRTWCVLLRENA